jgi:hypothetical protein
MVTVVTACQRLPKAREEKYNRWPACSGPSGLAASNRAVDQSVHFRGSINSDHTRSIGALIVAAGQIVSVIPKSGLAMAIVLRSALWRAQVLRCGEASGSGVARLSAARDAQVAVENTACAH